MTVENTNSQTEKNTTVPDDEPAERAIPPEALSIGKLPAHGKDGINMVAAVLLAILWISFAVLSARLRPAAPEIERALTWFFVGAVLLTLGGGLVWRHVLRMAVALEISQRQIARLAVTDSMTGVFNHAGFVSVLERDLARSKRYGHVFSIMVMDIDFFRRINDGYGHAVGDKVIVALAETIAVTLRSVDFLGRVSGAGFAIGLPDTSLEQAGQLAERLRQRIASVEVPGSGGEHVRFTVSIGVAMQVSDEAASLMSRASAVLQKAKDEGRNRVAVDPAGATVPGALAVPPPV